MAKRRRFAPEKPGNHTKEGKGKLERGRRKKGREQKKSNGCTLSFYIGYFGDVFKQQNVRN